jgi:anti-sigma factor RsiW
MTECVSVEMRDALPDLIHGSLSAARAAEVDAHVASCAGCVAELDVLRSVMASAPRVPTLDIGRIVAAIPSPARRGFRLHQGGAGPVQSRRPQTVWSRPLLRAAATIAVVTAGGLSLLVGRDALNPERQARPAAITVAAGKQPAAEVPVSPVPAGSTAAPEQQQARPVASAAGLSLVGELQDLSDEHLATLLSEMDRLNPLPGAEPESVTPAIGDSDTSGMNQ